MTDAEDLSRAKEFAQQAKDIAYQLTETLPGRSVSWTFTSRAYDELMRAVGNFEVSIKNLNEDQQ